MIEDAMKKLSESTREMDKRWEKIAADLRLEVERSSNRAVYTTISILGSLIILMGTVSSFAHYFIH